MKLSYSVRRTVCIVVDRCHLTDAPFAQCQVNWYVSFSQLEGIPSAWSRAGQFLAISSYVVLPICPSNLDTQPDDGLRRILSPCKSQSRRRIFIRNSFRMARMSLSVVNSFDSVTFGSSVANFLGYAFCLPRLCSTYKQ